MKNNTISDKLKDYIIYQKTNSKLLYVKEYWPTYKPFYDNNIVSMINQKTNSELEIVKPYLLKNNGEYSYSNISSITTFKNAYLIHRFKRLNIPYSEIMKK